MKEPPAAAGGSFIIKEVMKNQLFMLPGFSPESCFYGIFSPNIRLVIRLIRFPRPRFVCGHWKQAHSLTPPAVTPPTIYLESRKYTTMTGKIANAIIAYTCPISNVFQSELRSSASRIGSVFFILLLMIRFGVK